MRDGAVRSVARCASSTQNAPPAATHHHASSASRYHLPFCRSEGMSSAVCCGYNTRMSETKRRPGRLPGETSFRRLSSSDTDEGIALLREMARQEGCSAAAFMRGLIRKEAAERGVAAPAVVRDPER